MAICYVSHKYGGDPYNIKVAKKITHDLQTNDLKNTYICPLLALSQLGYKEIGRDEEMELCLDILSVCDVLVVASEISDGVQMEIDFANLVGMEVIYLEEEYGSVQSVKV